VEGKTMVIKGPAAAALALLLAACAQPAPEQSQPAAQPTAQAPAESATPSPGAAQPPAGATAQPSTLQPPAAERGEAAAPAQAPASAEAGRRPAAPAREQAPSEGSRAAATESTRPAETSAADTASPPPPAKKVPEFREVTIPAGTEIAVRLSTPLASDKNTVEDRVRGTVTSPIRVGGVTAIPAGSVITGTVREVNRSGRVKGRAVIAYGFERLEVRDETHSISTGLVRHEAEPDRSDDVKKGAIGGAAGAIIGGIAGGGKGAAIGAAIGGAGTVMVTRGDEVRLEPGTTVRTTLREPLTVRVPVN
jgi:hypothetical protein